MLKDVGGVGQRGKVVEVSDGYALNYLIPQGKAEQATPQKEAEANKRLEEQRIAQDNASAAIRSALDALDGESLTLKAKASEKGGLFKAITAGDIAALILNAKGIQISDTLIHLDKPIKEVGEHTVVIKHEKAASKMRLVVEAK